MKSLLTNPFTGAQIVDNANCGTGTGGFKKGNTCAQGTGTPYSLEHLNSASIIAGKKLFDSHQGGLLHGEPMGVRHEGLSERLKSDGSDYLGDFEYVFFPSAPGKVIGDYSSSHLSEVADNWKDIDGKIYTYSAEDEMVNVITDDRNSEAKIRTVEIPNMEHKFYKKGPDLSYKALADEKAAARAMGYQDSQTAYWDYKAWKDSVLRWKFPGRHGG